MHQHCYRCLCTCISVRVKEKYEDIDGVETPVAMASPWVTTNNTVVPTLRRLDLSAGLIGCHIPESPVENWQLKRVSRTLAMSDKLQVEGAVVLSSAVLQHHHCRWTKSVLQLTTQQESGDMKEPTHKN